MGGTRTSGLPSQLTSRGRLDGKTRLGSLPYTHRMDQQVAAYPHNARDGLTATWRRSPRFWRTAAIRPKISGRTHSCHRGSSGG